MRILILADDCNPDWPSLPVVGFKAAKALADKTDVMVVTHVRNRANIEKVGFGRVAVEYVDNEYIAAPMYRLAEFLRGGSSVGWTTNIALAYPSYLAFEHEVWKRFGSQIRSGRFDVIHRLTPMSPTLPSPIAAWSSRYRVPFVLGPLNGGLKWPSAYRAELAKEREWLSYLREAYRHLPYLKSTFRRSAAILAAFDHTATDVGSEFGARIVNFPEVGIDPEIFGDTRDRPRHRPRKTFLFVGRLVPYKLPRLAVEAFCAHPALRAHRMIVVGDGPERLSLEQAIRDCGCADRVQLCGWKTQAEVAELMRQSDILVQPSIRELGAGVVIEAMACGLPCVVTDYGGPAMLIDSDRGIKVPVAPYEALRTSIGEALARLADDEDMIVRMGEAAKTHAERHYTWAAKADKLMAVYDWVLGRGHKPDYFASGVLGEGLG
jgi:glycosyltransferase involved in cell wall biosynthesis